MSCGRHTLKLLLTASLILAGASVAAAANWPRFRGPNGTGVATDKDIPVKWDAQNGILWKVALPGVANSSPIIWGKHLFTQAASKDGSQRMLLCLDVTDGKILWSRTVSGSRAKTHAKNTLASSTPATDGERVYAAFWDGKDIAMVAYDFAGNLLWRRDLGKFISQHGAGASPIVYRDKILFANDQDGSAVLLALDAKTGKTAWQVTRQAFRACYSAPFLLERPGLATEVVVVSTGGITGYNPDNGHTSWHWPWVFDGMPLRTTGSPVYADGMIFACSGDGGGDRHMVAVKLENNGNGTRPVLAWENKRAFPYVPTLLVRGPHLYFVNDKGIAGCYVARTGEPVWSERLEGTVAASPVLIDGKIYAANEDGDVYVLAAEPTFHLLAKNSLGERVMASPAVADGRLFIRGQSHLFCIGKMAGR
jgi:outer membrane protein assembly factor BamB